MILVIDNYDSFTYNLVQYIGELGAEPVVYRNDSITPKQARELAPSHIIISPGPGTPDDAGVSKAIITEFAGQVPILGVCLGHQAIGEVFGAKVTKAPYLMHGKVSEILYTPDEPLFGGVENPFSATRYHSLVIDRGSVEGAPLQVTARTADNIVMAVRHREYTNLLGIQFHPESILTRAGYQMLSNFIISTKI